MTNGEQRTGMRIQARAEFKSKPLSMLLVIGIAL